ncbi:MAG: sulfatase [Acidobacteriota bacterium]
MQEQNSTYRGVWRLLRSICLIAALVVALGLRDCGVPTEPPVRVVLLTLDTLRYDSFSEPGAMPQLRRWAESSTVFERFYSSTASTQPSHASMFTGLHPWEHGVTGNGMTLDDSFLTIAERLQAGGFTTAAVVSSFPVSKRLGFAQGFDHFDDEFQLGSVPEGEWQKAITEGPTASDPAAAGSPESSADASSQGADSQAGADQRFYSLGDHVTERALALIDAASGPRQFFWFHYFDPHGPYGDTEGQEQISPNDVLELGARGEDTTEALARARRLYDVDVTYLDRAIGRVLDRLASDESEIETHVIVTADHGESFGEHGGSMGHGRRLIPSQIHVPLIVRSPRLAPGTRVDVTGSIDIAATLLGLAGVDSELETARPARSRDLSQIQENRAGAFGMRRTYREVLRDYRIDGSWVPIEGHLFFFVDAEGVLHRGNRDAAERHAESDLPEEGLLSDGLPSDDLPSDDPAEGGQAEGGLTEDDSKRLRGLFGGFEDAIPQPDGELDPEIEEGLRALGYVG